MENGSAGKMEKMADELHAEFEKCLEFFSAPPPSLSETQTMGELVSTEKALQGQIETFFQKANEISKMVQQENSKLPASRSSAALQKDIEQLKESIERKDLLIKKNAEKLKKWKSKIEEVLAKQEEKEEREKKEKEERERKEVKEEGGEGIEMAGEGDGEISLNEKNELQNSLFFDEKMGEL
eukprot:TRINITY_DN3702_c0_g2_i3.p1 TRINITY_DN3702_c0_g2~~TRINITY_DN3702_c0_g2_i3.p1  ORF type:complete len:208 (+),score=103.45 TRINITY_DN3702_c0_g2_i3:80-625(+)